MYKKKNYFFPSVNYNYFSKKIKSVFFSIFILKIFNYFFEPNFGSEMLLASNIKGKSLEAFLKYKIYLKH